ncbi:MAG: hypothetical protein IPO00_17255 [Betaproteobacteria bacterium]|nr:hypothetical protein [Betaproteobacteria bacterium]
MPLSVRGQIERELVLNRRAAIQKPISSLFLTSSISHAGRRFCQGRGSAANSAVCYALGITEVDPAFAQICSSITLFSGTW